MTIRTLITRITALITRITAWVMALKPVRVFTHFAESNGAILSGGMAYQSIFAVFAAVWVGFSIAGLWLTSHPAVLDALIQLINQSVPGLIGSDGVIDPDQLTSASVLSWTGALALVGLIGTALGWLSTTKLAVRTIFQMPRDTTFFVLEKARELGLGVGFGLLLVMSALISIASTEALSWLFGLAGLPQDSFGETVVVRVSGLLLVLIIDTVTLAVLFRVLSSVRIPLRRLIIGSLFGAVGLGALKVLGSTLLGGAERNPLLAAFAVIVGLLIWFNLTGTVTLLAASWIAIGMQDAGLSPRTRSAADVEEQQRQREADALRLAAEVELREARDRYETVPWYKRRSAGRQVREAEDRVTAYAADHGDTDGAGSDVAAPK